MNFDFDRIFSLLLAIPAFVAALTVHEFAHAWMAVRLGDDTPRRMGRLTLDPLSHLDPIGSLVFLMSALSGFGFGWAKPVPFNPRNLDHPRRDAMLIAVAGPVSNLLQIPIWLFLLWIFRLAAGAVMPAFQGAPDSLMQAGLMLLVQGVIINMMLAAFNMIPIPPLDGHYILEGLGPPAVTDFFNTIRPYSFLILMGIMWYTPLVDLAISPFLTLAVRAVFFVLGVDS